MSVLFRQNCLLQRLLGLFTLLFLGATLPLWTLPPSKEIPQIPWFSWAINLPFSVDQFCLICLGMFAVAMILHPRNHRWRRVVLCGYLVCFSGLVIFDQHRLQPWALHFLLTSAVLALATEIAGLRYCRWIVLTIYFYSAVSKIDSAFLTTHGQLLLNGLFQAVQIDDSFWSDQSRKFVAALFPVGEMIVVLLLLLQRTWRWGVVASWLMHVSILLAVGPLGLRHENGVLLWNIYFMLQNVVLFWRVPEQGEPAPTLEGKIVPSRPSFAWGLTVLFFALPLFENWGWYDHWPAWAVYSSRPEKVTVLAGTSATGDFPEFLRELCGPPKIFAETVPVSLERWAFEKRKCPAYPQLRYRLALAKALLTSFINEDEITIQIELTPNRWTGQRTSQTLHGWKEIDEELSSFWLNTEPRKVHEMAD